MVRNILRAPIGRAGAAQQGFTLVETMVAMAITVVVLLANIYLLNTAHKDLAHARAVTDATNLATGKIADFRAMTISEIDSAAPNQQAAPNPYKVHWGRDFPVVDGTQFTRTWTVSAIDLHHTNPPHLEMEGALAKIKIDVAWTSEYLKVVPTPENNGQHHVIMTTFVTEKAP